MIIGVPKEVKQEEYRVSVTPSGAGELKAGGHTILVEQGAGLGSGFSDEEYLEADADILGRDDVFGSAELIVKVKEPLPQEFGLFREGQALLTYLHLAPNRRLTEFLLNRKITAIGYETIEKDGKLPLLTPMSEIAGRMAPIMGSYYLQRIHGGEGVLVTGATGVRPAKAVVLGAGVVGANAVRVCVGLGMETVVINNTIDKLRKLDELYGNQIRTLPSTTAAIASEIRDADLIIGAVLVPGGKTPLLITREMLGTMKKGSVIVDISIDQGGCVETSRPSTHDDPVYIVDGILHYTVANMPGAYPRTSTIALTNVTLPCIKSIALLGIEGALNADAAIRSGLNTRGGMIVHPTVAASFPDLPAEEK